MPSERTQMTNSVRWGAHRTILVYLEQHRNIHRSDEGREKRRHRKTRNKRKGASKEWAHDDKVQMPVMKGDGREGPQASPLCKPSGKRDYSAVAGSYSSGGITWGGWQGGSEPDTGKCGLALGIRSRQAISPMRFQNAALEYKPAPPPQPAGNLGN